MTKCNARQRNRRTCLYRWDAYCTRRCAAAQRIPVLLTSLLIGDYGSYGTGAALCHWRYPYLPLAVTAQGTMAITAVRAPKRMVAGPRLGRYGTRRAKGPTGWLPGICPLVVEAAQRPPTAWVGVSEPCAASPARRPTISSGWWGVRRRTSFTPPARGSLRVTTKD
jgi:hypothetical protein